MCSRTTTLYFAVFQSCSRVSSRNCSSLLHPAGEMAYSAAEPSSRISSSRRSAAVPVSHDTPSAQVMPENGVPFSSPKVILAVQPSCAAPV